MSPSSGKRRPWLGPALGLVVIFAAGMIALWAVIFSTWSDLRLAPEGEAARAFGEALDHAGGGPAYLVVTESGSVRIRRDLEKDPPAPLRALNILAWEAETARLVRVRLPFWFVRAKMTERLNLGTLTAGLAGDWRNLDLRVGEGDLRRRGPGLVLDRSFADGSRVVLWTE